MNRKKSQSKQFKRRNDVNQNTLSKDYKLIYFNYQNNTHQIENIC